MTIKIATTPSFDEAIARLQMKDKGHVLDFLQKFQKNPAHPGLSVERVQRALSPNIWSARTTGGLRCIFALDGETRILLWVDEHDSAYEWAGRRRLDRHEVTGELQFVAVPESVDTPAQSTRSTVAVRANRLFTNHADDYLLSLGVPREWLPFVREIERGEQILEAEGRLPVVVIDRLLELADGKLVPPPTPLPAAAPTETVASSDQIHVVRDEDELQFLLSAPFEQWARYLHPSQHRIVQRDAKGPLKVTGSAGTGKTVVAMHRAAHLARSGQRVLLTSFSRTLVRNIERSLVALCDEATRSNIHVGTIHAVARELCARAKARVEGLGDEDARQAVREAAKRAGAKYDAAFLWSEFDNVVARGAIRTWDEYRDASRAGRGRPLSVRDRKEVWDILGPVIATMESSGRLPWSYVSRRARESLEADIVDGRCDAVIVDELQDLGPEELRLVAALGGERRQIMLVGDAGQRIYTPRGMSLKAAGIDVRGRSFVLRINYRTTEQIRRAADRILPSEIDDLDDGRESRRGTRSVLRGPQPSFHGFADENAQVEFVARRIHELQASGVPLENIGVFAPKNELVKSLARDLSARDVPNHLLDDDDAEAQAGVGIGTMHRAKGLQFRAVFVTGISADLVPPAFVNQIADAAEREDKREQQRQLVYVAMTRPRDLLCVTWVGKQSPFLDDVVTAVH
ncbi:MAG: DEAD/DEAH box helicase [Planctomycetes bacterium]|nr:DEAD/DEAH box helicase [Planctomycetota bacterium]